MNGIACRAAEFRRQLFQETGARRGLQPVIVEKDFWVCWTLRQLFCISDLQSHLVFKGGTTLSKIHSIIRRFSEDIDVTVGREILGFSGERDPELAASNKKRKQLTEEMIQACRDFVQGLLLEAIRRQCSYLFKASQEVEAWSIDPDPNAEDGQTILFKYPASVSGELAYVKPVVRLELGSRADAWPTTAAQIQPYAAEEFPNLFTEPVCSVVALDAERTFWEKATILHEEAYRPPDKLLPPRYSRHYYDLALLAASPVKKRAFGRLDLLSRVVEHKKFFFRRSWSNYEAARLGTLRLLPASERIAELKTDYNKMAVMIFGEPPPFEDLLASLGELEAEINSLPAASATE